jgi:hypothetical protein
LASFRNKVLAVSFFKAIDIFQCCFGEGEFGLSSRDSFALPTDNTVDSMFVRHDVYAEYAVTVRCSLKHDAVFGDLASQL